jgi:hypothetical protein
MTRGEFQQMLDQHGIVFVGEAAWRVAQLVAAAEREACAKVCESVAAPYQAAGASVALECAVAIRARGEK